MAKLILLVGETVAVALGFVIALGGIGATDENGRVPMPGRKVLALPPGDFDVYYEEPVQTSDNEIFEPPEGIRVKVEGVGRAPDPKLELGGLGNQVGTQNRTAESIGTLAIARQGRYRVTASRVEGGTRPSITLGKPLSTAFLRGGLWYGYVTVGTVGLALLVVLIRRLRGT